MGMLGRLRGKITGTVKQAEQGGRGGGKTDRNVGGRQGGTPAPPELPLDDAGNDGRNIGG